MTTLPTGGFARHEAAPRLTRFVLVNERIPRANAACAFCGTGIARGYVRNPHTRLVYCDTECFAEYENAMLPATMRRARRVS